LSILDRALTELEDRGLIGWDREANRYDSHPIVRGVVWQIINVDDKRSINAALEAHFKPMAKTDDSRIKSIGDLAPAIEHFHTLVGLGRYGDAYYLFQSRLDRPSLYRLATHLDRIQWLEQFFPEGVDGLPRLGSQQEQSEVLHALAMSYSYSGRPNDALPFFRKADAIDIQIPGSDQPNQLHQRQIGLTEYGLALLETGGFRESISVL
jgi:hypothetical protein